jgi:uncharacterized membrane protein YoaT (DUF817 family)
MFAPLLDHIARPSCAHAGCSTRVPGLRLEASARLHFRGPILYSDFRWYIVACTLGLYARTTVTYIALHRKRSMPLLLSFVLIGFFIWLAENISTFFGVWRYPNQIGAWATVQIGKWSSWSLLVIMTFTIVANLKHIKAHIHVPE